MSDLAGWRLMLLIVGVAVLAGLMFAGARSGMLAAREELASVDRLSLALGAIGWLIVPVVVVGTTLLRVEVRQIGPIYYLPLIASLVSIVMSFFTPAETGLSGFYLKAGLLTLPITAIIALEPSLTGNPGH